MRVDEPVLRIASPADEEAIDALMKASAAELFPRSYDEQQARSAVRYVAQVDAMLLADGTYFVLEAGGELVGCGGWSRRNRHYTGSGESDDDDRLLDPATEPARVRAMFVRADWTRRGLGRRILDACEEAAKREGFRRLVLVATMPGVPLYLAYGFEPLDDLEVEMPDGVTIPCVSMEKAIPDMVAFRAIRPDELEWIARPHEPGEPARHVAELSERAGFAHTRANVWRYEPGARGRRHRHPIQEETFVVLAGTLTMYLGDPPVRRDVPTGGLIHVEPGTPLQTVNHGAEDLIVYAYGTPPESEHAEILDSAV